MRKGRRFSVLICSFEMPECRPNFWTRLRLSPAMDFTGNARSLSHTFCISSRFVSPNAKAGGI